jgi:AraC-like DNA-binding protein
LSLQNHLALQLSRVKSSEEFVPHSDGLTFIFPKGGQGKCATRAESHRLGPGEVLIISGTTGGKLAVHDKGEFLFWSFSLCFENLMPLFSGNEISLLHNLTEGFKAPKIFPASHPVAVECHRLLTAVPPQFNLDHRGQLVRIAATLLSSEFHEAQARRGGYIRAEDHMVQVFEKLSASEIITLSVGELAERFSCSRRHLNRLFHQHFGLAVATLRMEMRLLKAMSLLRDPDAKVINVAEQCGFNHLGLFNTCFKRRFGSSPGQWRKSALQSGEPAPLSSDQKPTCPLHSNGLCPWGGHVEPLPHAPVQPQGGVRTAKLPPASRPANSTETASGISAPQRSSGDAARMTLE